MRCIVPYKWDRRGKETSQIKPRMHGACSFLHFRKENMLIKFQVTLLKKLRAKENYCSWIPHAVSASKIILGYFMLYLLIMKIVFYLKIV